MFFEVLVHQLSILLYNIQAHFRLLLFALLYFTSVVLFINGRQGPPPGKIMTYFITVLTLLRLSGNKTAISPRYTLERFFILLLFHVLFNERFGQPKASLSFSETSITWRVDLESHKLFGREMNNRIYIVER